jgi:hypothetical protein
MKIDNWMLAVVDKLKELGHEMVWNIFDVRGELYD